jgi:competence protein ComEC
MLPGAYDFARTAWFAGISATGSALGSVTVLSVGESGGWFERTQARLSQHVRDRLSGSAGAIAAAFASGDRGAIAETDDDAMRDAGLTHLLSISGLHVSAVVAAAYLIALRLLALWPWLALRVRLPLVAAGAGAAAGVFYTLLTGAEVPTVRSCIGAVLVLAALALGREPLSLRMVAVAAFFVLLLWPEAVVGPSFQMSFAAVIAIVALHGAEPVRAFLAPRDEAWAVRMLRRVTMLLATGVVIELAIMPIGLFHFHRAGVYGALANVIAIPLTTAVTMPLIAIALALDLVGAGAPAWWLCGKSIDLMLALAHWVAGQPGAVTTLPAIGRASMMLFVAGGLWLALWRGRVRLWGLAPVLVATASLGLLHAPDILVSGDGHHVGITGEGNELLVLRDERSDFARDNLTELAGMDGDLRQLADWPGARCSRDFCAVELQRGGRAWHLLIGRGRDMVPERELAAVCDRADIVISDRWLPRSCRPAMLKADRRLLSRTGGLAIDLAARRVETVAQTQGEHGWWQKPESAKPHPNTAGAPNSIPTPGVTAARAVP